MSNLTKQRDEWHNFGGTYIRSGVTRGTSTSTGVISVDTGFSRQVVFALATDEATRLSTTQTGGGPADTQSTFYWFQPITPNNVTARFRVQRFRGSTGEGTFTMTLASTVTGLTYRWLAFGY